MFDPKELERLLALGKPQNPRAVQYSLEAVWAETRDYLQAHAEELLAAWRIEAAITSALPATFYADLPAGKRVSFMAEQWNKALQVNHSLEEEVGAHEVAATARAQRIAELEEESAEYEQRAEGMYAELWGERNGLQVQVAGLEKALASVLREGK